MNQNSQGSQVAIEIGCTNYKLKTKLVAMHIL